MSSAVDTASMSPEAGADSRSSSPATPEATDSPHSIIIQSDLEASNSWYLPPMQQRKPLSDTSWDVTNTGMLSLKKPEDDQMLQLDELLEQHAYEDSPMSSYTSPLTYPSIVPQSLETNPLPSTSGQVLPNFKPGTFLIPSFNGSISSTKPIPPPTPLPRKQDLSSTHQRVVFPPKESCINLPIMVPSIPEGGTKSRVETQVRVTIDLADASSSSDPRKYDCVGSWKWLRLPPGTSTKKRTRKQGKIDPDPQDILHLSTTVTCASPPHNRVLSCSSCQAREAKRVAKKLAARVRPARSDTDSGDDPSLNRPKVKRTEDTTSIIQFNCAEILDFSTGSAVLPLRITCYCRHHREKVGFIVHFTMMDHHGRIVGTGSSRPIMITDDHKTAPSANATRQSDLSSALMNMDSEWSQARGVLNELSAGNRAPSKRKQEAAVKRPKPYDSANKPARVSREGSVASAPSPPTTFSSPITRSPTPSTTLQNIFPSDVAAQSQLPQLQYSSTASLSSSPDSLVTPLDQSPDNSMATIDQQSEIVQTPPPASIPVITPTVVMPAHPHPMPYMFFDPHVQANMPIQIPTIHRLIPNIGPTHGGIEVTVLGANFHPSLELNCVFGDAKASSTQRWSDNTLVCVLPPRATAGVVAVWFEGYPKAVDQTNTPPSLFTYADESDRALMELALQVVGLKMTGKIEDAKNVAMRIVGGTDPSESQNGSSNSGAMQLASSPRDLRPFLLGRTGANEGFENVLIDFLKILDAPLDHPAPQSIPTSLALCLTTSSGHTLLHLAVFLGFSSLAVFLIKRGIDLDARDKNGYTALHFAATSKSEICTRILLDAGADREIVNALGKTPQESWPNAVSIFDESDLESEESDSDEEAQWGDVEEAEGEVIPVRQKAAQRRSRRNLHRGGVSGQHTPTLTYSPDIPSATTPPLQMHPPESFEKKGDKLSDVDGVDSKQTASFIEMIQRTFAQIPAPQGIIPNIPQLPLPHLPNFPGMPAVPWGVLPQLPIVFPIYVPMMPAWPTIFGGEHQEQDANKVGQVGDHEAVKGMGAGAIRTAQELRAIWEKWFALAVATARQGDAPPPVYTPRDSSSEQPLKIPETTEGPKEISEQVIPASLRADEASAAERDRPTPAAADIRPLGYNMDALPDQEVNAYGYQPNTKRTQKLKKKHDKMLLIFWLPVLFVSIVWAIHTGLQFAVQALKTVFPAKTPSII